MLWKYVRKEALFGCTDLCMPSCECPVAPADLLKYAKASKGVQIRWASKNGFVLEKTERQRKRRKQVLKKNKTADSLSSEMSNC